MSTKQPQMYTSEEIEQEVSSRLASWWRGTPAGPVRAIILPTRRCNLDCWFCNTPPEERSGQAQFPAELTHEQWKPIVEEGVQLGIRDWWFPGTGEPLFRRDCLVSIVKAIKKNDPRAAFKMTTNGTLFTGEVIRLFVMLGMSSITFSIDGPTAAVHDGLRRKKGSFAKAIQALHLFPHYKALFARENPSIYFTYVLNAKNYTNLPEYIEFANEFGVEHISINPLRITGGNRKRVERENLRIMPDCTDECRTILNDSQKLARKYGIDLHLNADELLEIGDSVCEDAQDFEEEKKQGTLVDSPCLEPWYTVSVDPWGNAAYCANWGFGSPEHNVLKHGLRSLWFGEPFTKMRKSLLKHQPFDVCFGCGIYRNRDMTRRRFVDAVNKGNVKTLEVKQPS